MLIWVRPIRSWLPSAAAQWGILHKQQPGPVQPLERQAEALIAWYAHLPRWTETFGAAVTVLPFDRQRERRAAAATMQLRRLSQPHVLAARDRLDLAVALDQPQTFLSTEAVTAEVQRLRREAAEATARMQAREAELLSSTSWRVTAPLRAVSRIMRRGRR